MKKFLGQKIILILFAMIGSVFALSLFLQNEVSKIQTNLPLSIMEDQRLIDEVTNCYAQMVMKSHQFSSAPTKENFSELVAIVDKIFTKISKLEAEHHFATVSGMPYVMAIVKPIVIDLHEWLEINFPNGLEDVDNTQAIIFLSILKNRLDQSHQELDQEMARIDSEVIDVLRQESSRLNQLIDLLQIPYFISFMLMVVLVIQLYLRMTDKKYQKELSKRVSQAEARFLNALEALPEGFVLFDDQDRFLFANSALYKNSHLNKKSLGQEVTFQGFASAVVSALGPIYDDDAILSNWQSDMLRVHRKDSPHDDTYLEIGDREFRFREYLLNADYCLLQVSDVTRQRHRERELKEAVGQAEGANRAKSEFLAMMSHELRTPLNAIIGFTDIMRKHLFGPIENDRYNIYLKDIHKSSRHLLDLIEDILDLSKIESGNASLTLSQFRIQDIIEDVITLLRERASVAEIELSSTINLPSDTPMQVYGDERYTKQMLINLVSNALKFTQIKYQEKSNPSSVGRVHLNVILTDEQQLRIDVEDNGIGICEKDLPKITDAFYQVEHQMNRRHEGTGLGLSLVKSLIELHGGKLMISSIHNRGTTCSIFFPKNRLQHIAEG